MKSGTPAGPPPSDTASIGKATTSTRADVGARRLGELALDLRCNWNHSTDHLWRRLDSKLWEATQNPWIILQTVSRGRIEECLADPQFLQDIDDHLVARRELTERPAWFQQKYPQTALRCIAYFSMEFMLSEALPIYSGGLGNVAGDQLKAASDLGVPVLGVGLLFQQGYFRQFIDEAGEQQALYPFNDPGQLPITPLRTSNGEWLRLEIALPGYSLWLRIWYAQIGRVTLYLLDSNDSANIPVHRAITSELYGGGPELRLRQELVLGIGGWRLLVALGIRPDVCHLNEGHAAFAILERTAQFMKTSGQSFAAALSATRAGTLFTTHTAVSAGFDRYPPALIEQYLSDYASRELGISFRDLMALGREHQDDATEPFNMAYLAIRGSNSVNAVSRLHGEVSRRLFAPLFPRWPPSEVPIGHITNGVHVPTWDSAAADGVWTAACGKERWRDAAAKLEEGILKIPDATLWALRNTERQRLVDYIRNRLWRQLEAAGETADAVQTAKRIFDPKCLTLGFARRFATYKRPNLLLYDRARLLRLLSDPKRPVQLVIAGKAHPDDRGGQMMIKEWIEFIRLPDVRRHIVFLSDYDMVMAEKLVQGVDLWINTPRRPWEASGTSGMKILVNGGLNLSEVDGWWAEAYSPEVGWAIGDGEEHRGDADLDGVEANQLYTLLEREVIPQFYERGPENIPVLWTRRMRQSMATLTPRFSASRTVSEYTERHYLPMAEAWQARSAVNGRGGEDMAEWIRLLRMDWAGIRFVSKKIATVDNRKTFVIEVDLGAIAPEDVTVEIYAEAQHDGEPFHETMQIQNPPRAVATVHAFCATVVTSRTETDFTVRIIAHHAGASIPLEIAEILWQT